MITQTKQSNNINELKKEIINLRSFVIGLVGKDSEGNYQPGFVKKILASSSEEVIGKFTDAKNFLTLFK